MNKKITKTNDFTEVLNLITTSKQNIYKKINTALIELYWEVGKYISQKTTKDNWGKSIVKELAEFIKAKDPTIKGFNSRGLWRMKQFYEIYKDNKKVSTLLTQISWSNLFYHRALQCLVAIELKIGKFKPSYLGQLEFYLEALDRDVKKEYENPSIGILLCRKKNDEVVKYALNRSLSPTVVADYETKLIPKKVLQNKLNELYEQFKIADE